ncbi:histidine kinase [Neobacillus sp. 179-C4.2 HS]|uniref:Histidine kinase n=1 Tax=Neobacillus driksii TaxID=3035913 RepID=A0ABV4YQZ3_9BACI|nr:sensor histidine kinase [Neobacillus sp. 179.-C4.2 HS]MDP5194855.1 histidine kinase [Neobacillus sp. 179.-C4.2 HS]
MTNNLDKLYRRFFLKNLLSILAPMMVPILILGISSYYIIQHYIVGDLQKKNTAILDQSKENIELLFQEQDSLNLTIVASAFQFTELQKILNTEYPDIVQLRELANLKNFIDSPAIGKPFIDSIYVYIDNNFDRFLSSSNGGMVTMSTYPDTEWLNDLKSNENTENVVWTKRRTISKEGIKNQLYKEKVISLFRRVPLDNNKDSFVVLNIKESYLTNSLSQLATFRDQQILVLNEDKEVVASNYTNTKDANILVSQLNLTDSETNTVSTKDGNMIVMNQYADNYNWSFISLVPEDSLYKLPIQLKNLTLAMLLLSFCFSVWYAYFHTKKAGNHLRAITDLLSATRTQSQVPSINQNKENDIYQYITERLVGTFIKQDYLQMKVSRNEYQAQAAEFKALQSQLNPHFLYNTLDTINWRATALTGGHSSLNEMVENLSDILRYSLDEPGNLVPLNKEKLYTDSYISIQQIRYRETFKVNWSIDPIAYKYLMLKLLFQPLIENSIYHGFSQTEVGGQIKIKIKVRSKTLHIAIIDNGKGMNKQQLHDLQVRLELETNSGRHIGLSNTYKRIQLVYGNQAKMQVKSKKGYGTMIVIETPIH